jgi:hypothetical protein
MGESYVTLWSKERCREVDSFGDKGPLMVVFGGPHSSMPSVSHLKGGDLIYIVAISGGILFLVGRMKIVRVMDSEAAMDVLLPTMAPDTGSWDEYYKRLPAKSPTIGHRIPSVNSCTREAALGEEGTEIRFDRPVPAGLLAEILLGPKGRETPPKGLKNNKLTTTFSFQGRVRRLHPESAKIFDHILATYQKLQTRAD